MTSDELIYLAKEIVKLLQSHTLIKEVKTEIITRPTSLTSSETVGSNTVTKYHLEKW